MDAILVQAKVEMTGELGWGTKIEGGWFQEEGHVYRCDNGIERPSSTQVFGILGMVDFGNVKEDVLEFKRQYGTAIHVGMEHLANGELDWDTVDPRIIDPLTGIETFFKRNEFEVEACEEVRIVTHCGMLYGMRLDLRGTIMYQGQRRHVIADLKTGVKWSKTWDWQLGSYIIPQPKVEKGWLGVIFQVHPDGRVIPHYVQDVQKAQREFQVLLASAIIKVNEGFAKIQKAA